jgi:signal transduction histidine kinase
MENKSFLDSIISIVNNFMKNTDIQITLNNSLPKDMKLTSQAEIAIFRVIQESVTNSVRHGKSNKVEITIKQENNKLELNISDNGTGCSNIKKGYGMQGIKERTEALDGTAEFSSSPGKGFKTRVLIPFEVIKNEN